MGQSELKLLKSIHEIASYECNFKCNKCYFCTHQSISGKTYLRCTIADLDRIEKNMLKDCFNNLDTDNKRSTRNDKN